MINVLIDRTQYLQLLKDGRFDILESIFLPEISYYFKFHNTWHRIYMRKGKSTLVYRKDNIKFLEWVQERVLMDSDFLKRNIIAVTNKDTTQPFCRALGMEYFFNPQWSENIWTHRSNANFIYKYECPIKKEELVQKIWSQFNYLISLDELERPHFSFRLNDPVDQIVYNYNVLSDIINDFHIPFSINSDKTISISKKNRNLAIAKINLINYQLHPFKDIFNYNI